MKIQMRLLDHPFYQAWNRGEVSPQTMGLYHRSYGEFIRDVPSLWGRVVDALRPDSPLGAMVVQEEVDHASLWEAWGNHFPSEEGETLMHKSLRAFESMTPSSLLGAVHAFEIQQPEVARLKKEGLMRHYGVPESVLRYFDEHQDEARHIAYGAWLGRHFAERREFEAGFRRGQEIVYHSLDDFVTS